MASDKAQLMEMGFEADRIAWALQATKNAGLQPALDHIVANMDNPVPAGDEPTAASGSAGKPMDVDDDEDEDDQEALQAHIKKMGGDPTKADDVEAKSVKCTDCGKIFKNTSLVSFHAEKSGHSNFEESTEEYVPLTEEERKAKLEDLRKKLVEKRARQAEEDTKANKANEILRRKAGQDAGKIKEDLKIKAMEKEAAQAKKDKELEAKARAAVKLQIEADKKARAEKAAKEKALRAGEQPPQAAASSGPAIGGAASIAAAAGSGLKGKDYPDTRLQIRLSTGGAPLTKTLPSDSPLSAVAEFIASENLSFNADSVKLSMTFPRKTFGPGDMNKSLRDNGLTPSAVSAST
ncbi:hypothetical protein FFLO_05761 [Filobasidium floriforme]|uniref:Uncharacterized protein n=1 Tax=Filobasidium floriforme TaxID=5210 RepID=A0A8K0JG66_9TREE|nr:hypothetical protein FFLO_05761 [Filobasidium floriforme]